MDVDVNTRLRHLRRQRNAAVVVAVLLVLVGFSLTLPTSLARYRAVRAAQAELIGLQKEINDAQSRILEAQFYLRQAQGRIDAARGN